MASVCTHYIDNLIDTTLDDGIATAGLLATAGLPATALDNRNGRIDYDDYMALWRAAMELSGKPLLGLEVGRQFHPGYMGDLASVLATAPTLQSAIEQLVRHERLLQDGIETRFVEIDGMACIEFHCDWADPEVIRPVVEKDVAESLALAEFILREARRDESIKASRIEFRHAPAGPEVEYSRWLRAPVRFNAPTNRLYFDRAYLTFPTHSGNSILFDSVVAQLEQQADDSFAGRLRQYLAGALAEGVPEIHRAAEQFHVSERTLQRRLSGENTNYSEQVRIVREQLACQLLRHSDCSVSEVAHRLGFTEPSAFNQAFRRWLGMSPSAYRQSPGED
ncbi:MAG: AraC family transcriptional regulator [Pseudomonadota bacterium]